MKINYITMGMKFLDSNAIPTEDLGNGVNRQILGFDDKIMLVRVNFKVNSIGVLHSHIHSQTTFVLKGIFEVTIDGETKTLKEGDSFFVASGLIHGVKCLKEGSLLDSFSPARKDFLPGSAL
jgi:quercetin dioxygenase-like cupin family protein